MTRAVDFWFEFASSYSYPAVMLAEQRAPAGVSLSWRPFLLGPIFRAQGWSDSPFALVPAKGRYMWRDVARICEAEGLPFEKPSRFPQNGLAAARLALVGLAEGWGATFTRAVFLMHFSGDADISDPAVLSRAVREAGGDPEAAVAAASGEEIKQQLRAQTEAAQSAGIFGAPTFTVGEEMFWGFDRMEQAFAWATRS